MNHPEYLYTKKWGPEENVRVFDGCMEEMRLQLAIARAHRCRIERSTWEALSVLTQSPIWRAE